MRVWVSVGVCAYEDENYEIIDLLDVTGQLEEVGENLPKQFSHGALWGVVSAW